MDLHDTHRKYQSLVEKYQSLMEESKQKDLRLQEAASSSRDDAGEEAALQAAAAVRVALAERRALLRTENSPTELSV
jgi:hypothetical protein